MSIDTSVRSLATVQVREEILYYCRESVRCGLNFNTQGNISVRITADDGTEAIVITPSGVRYDVMRPRTCWSSPWTARCSRATCCRRPSCPCTSPTTAAAPTPGRSCTPSRRS